jgi:hypothetical protein
MWAIALIVTIAGVTQVHPGTIQLYTKADCDRFGEIWEETYKENGGEGTTDHLCVELQAPGVDI